MEIEFAKLIQFFVVCIDIVLVLLLCLRILSVLAGGKLKAQWRSTMSTIKFFLENFSCHVGGSFTCDVQRRLLRWDPLAARRNPLRTLLRQIPIAWPNERTSNKNFMMLLSPNLVRFDELPFSNKTNNVLQVCGRLVDIPTTSVRLSCGGEFSWFRSTLLKELNGLPFCRPSLRLSSFCFCRAFLWGSECRMRSIKSKLKKS